jgi:hypothetical protein
VARAWARRVPIGEDANATQVVEVEELDAERETTAVNFGRWDH